ncbi:MAG: Asp23/Gls24 family envelope stress response protein [Enterococcus sp.]
MEELKKTLTIDDLVVKKIAGITVQEVSGVLGLSGNVVTNLADRFRNQEDATKGISVEVGTKQATIELTVIGEYGKDLSKTFDMATQRVCDAVKYMTGLDVVSFKMHVEDVLTTTMYKEKFEAKKEVTTKE